MNDAFNEMLNLQNEIIAAQKAQMEAMKDGLAAGGDLEKLQEAGQKAIDAQTTMWTSWLGFWGLR
jgi:uncharacterized membrane protein (DUF106 family)